MPDTPCPRCGTPQPPDSVHTCRGRIPQPQPSDASLAALREAEEIARSNVNLAVIYYGGACTYELDAYRDAVAARVRAELLASGTCRRAVLIIRPDMSAGTPGDTHG